LDDYFEAKYFIFCGGSRVRRFWVCVEKKNENEVLCVKLVMMMMGLKKIQNLYLQNYGNPG